jgi:cellulose synthase/poly-beta-1,6-N-acetylglucosamine synthase-like glycosyltransferase
MVYLYRKNTQYCTSDPEKTFDISNPSLPLVTVQLPIYNEYYVVDRLIDSIVNLNYPINKLEIQVLDDSTDETVDKVKSIVQFYKDKGFLINHIHRKDRTGHKAGALELGMKVSFGITNALDAFI